MIAKGNIREGASGGNVLYPEGDAAAAAATTADDDEEFSPHHRRSLQFGTVLNQNLLACVATTVEGQRRYIARSIRMYVRHLDCTSRLDRLATGDSNVDIHILCPLYLLL